MYYKTSKRKNQPGTGKNFGVRRLAVAFITNTVANDDK